MLALQQLGAACLVLSLLSICNVAPVGSAFAPPQVSFHQAGSCNLSGPLDTDACQLQVLKQEPLEGLLQPGEVRYVSYDHTEYSQGMSWAGYSWKAEIPNVDWTQTQAVMLVLGVARSISVLQDCIRNLTAPQPQPCHESHVPYIRGTAADDNSTVISYVYPSNATIPTNFTNGNRTWVENITATIIGWSKTGERGRQIAPPDFTHAPPTYGYVFFLGSLSSIPINFNFDATHVALPVVVSAPMHGNVLAVPPAMLSLSLAMLAAALLMLGR